MVSGGRACVVRIGQYALGIDGAFTRQVHGLNELRRVPRAPGALAGFFASRSQVIPIVVLEPLLNLPVPKHELAVQLEYSGRQFGVGIDAVLGFIPLQARSADAPFALAHLVEGSMAFGEQTVPMLSMPKVLEQLSVALGPAPARAVPLTPDL
ncbi:MAG: chemotaxis protein CheW [Deinococcales bacterium]